MPSFFHPDEDRLKRFVQFRHGYKAGKGFVLDGAADTKFKIPPFHRLFVLQCIELHTRWSETHEAYQSLVNHPDGTIVSEQHRSSTRNNVVVLFFHNHFVKND